MVRVEAPSRLHFGLLSLPTEGESQWPDPEGKPGLPMRAFGGVGLMIDRPGVVVEVQVEKEWSAEGILARRALAFAQQFVDALPQDERCGFHVRVVSCPPEHIGLGVGTSLGLCVARAIAVELGYGDWNSVELARRIGRGKRSAVGVHGFEHGGLIVEPGKLPNELIAPLTGVYPLPEAWRFLLFQSRKPPEWHGQRELEAFARAVQNNDTAALCRIVLTGMLPALAARDCALFGEAVHEFNVRAGQAFQSAQGGAFASEETNNLISRLRQKEIWAAQSSWGPTVVALFPDHASAEAHRQQIARESLFESYDVVECAAANRGARCVRM